MRSTSYFSLVENLTLVCETSILKISSKVECEVIKNLISLFALKAASYSLNLDLNSKSSNFSSQITFS